MVAGLDRYAEFSTLKFERNQDRVLEVVLSNPGRLNAVSAEGHGELPDLWRVVDRDPDTAVVIVRGEGEAFSAGGEMSFLEEMVEDPDVRMRAMREARDLVYEMINCSKPIVSAMHGVAVGAGLAVGILADISIVTPTTRLIDGHTRLGVAAGDHAVVIWPLLMGMAKAKYHLLTCEPLLGADAERMGLVSLCVPDDELLSTARSVAGRLAAGSASALGLTKHALNNWLRMAGPAFEASLGYEFLGFAGRDVREGIAAIRERRPPAFPPG